MSLIAEFRKVATELSTPERAEFAAFLLGTLEKPHHCEDDAEVHRRSEEMDFGAVRPIAKNNFRNSHKRLVRSFESLNTHESLGLTSFQTLKTARS